MSHKNNLKSSIRLFALICFFLFSPLAQSKIIDAKDYYVSVYPKEDHPRLGFIISKRLEFQHYRGMKLDDKLSEQVYHAYLKSLDPNRSIFTQQEIQQFDKFKNYVDDAFKQGKLEPAFIMFNQYLKNQANRLAFMLNQIENHYDEIDFSVDENLELDREDSDWMKDAAALKDLWRKQIKNNILAQKLSDKTDDEIRETLSKRLQNQLNRLKQTNSEDAFRIYINALTESYDPHTQYFSPRVSENFDIQMKLSLEGIGAMLSEEDGYTLVKRLVPGGPAHKAGQLKAGDKIIGVGQGNQGDVVDVVGWRLDEVVQLIRGKKGSIVRLKLIPSKSVGDHETKLISIVRNTVNLEEQSAKKDIIEIKENNKQYKIGVINLPTFYIDFKGAQENKDNYRSTTRDVKKLITELKQEPIDGLVIDLRNNGGGSLQEVNTLLGLFIKSGPTVQIRSADSETIALNNETEEVFYDGPLVVMVNRLSASASEIFAGAIQDYQRGIVVGSQTFGKGTVQALQPLVQGQLKLTHAKFYRVSGDSTQNHGVVPDIIFPPSFDHEELGESALPEALLWDQINPAEYQKYASIKKVFPYLNEAHQQRIKSDPDFIYMKKSIARLKSLKEKTLVSLNEKKRRTEFKQSQESLLAIENERRKAKNQPLFADIKAMKKSMEEIEEANETKANPEDDTDESKAYLQESAFIVMDLIKNNWSGKNNLSCVATC